MIRPRIWHLKVPTPSWELALTLGVVCLAVAIPTVGLLFFMNRAMNAEGQLFTRNLTASREEALREARSSVVADLKKRVQQWSELVSQSGDEPWRKFQALTASPDVSGALLLDEAGEMVFPVLTVPEDNVMAPQSLEGEGKLLAEYERKALLAGRFPDDPERLALADALGQPPLMHTPGPTGRRAWPAALLAALTGLPPDHIRREPLLKLLQEAVADYSHGMPSAQRLWLASELQKLGSPGLLPFAAAEALSLGQARGDAPSGKKAVFHASADPALFSIFLPEARAVIFINRRNLQEAILATATPLLAGQDLTAGVLPQGSSGGPPPVASAPLGEMLPGWELLAYGPDAANAAAGRVRHTKQVYLASAITGCLVIGLLAAWSIRKYALGARDTKTKQEFLSLVSHELKTPLTSIRLFVDTLDAEGLQDQTRARTYLDFIRRENERLSRLVENFLTFSRLGSGRHRFRFELIHPDEIADEVRAVVAGRLHTPHCQFQSSSESGLPLINADPEALVTALINLIDNAIKYSGEAKNITFTVTTGGGTVAFTITDNGFGMSPETVRQLGEKFYRGSVPAAYGSKGFGLGLFIVRTIISAHGGRLEIASTPGSGSCFALHLPPASGDPP